jgi:DNA replication protein DnaC
MNELTVRKLTELRLFGMAEKLKELAQSPKYASMTHEELLSHVVDREYDRRRNSRVERLLRDAKIKISNASIEDIEYSPKRNLKKEQIQNIIESRYLENHHNILISGSTGVGKSFIACALAQMACRNSHSVLYTRAARLLENVKQEKLLGNYMKALDRLGKVALLVVDDIGPDVMTKEERNLFFEIVEERYMKGATIFTSQLPLEQWYAVFEDNTVADAICDRIFHNAHKILLDGDSMRKMQPKKRE